MCCATRHAAFPGARSPCGIQAAEPVLTTPHDILIIGAGPVGLSTALHARRRGLRAAIVDQGPVANHLLAFPIGMAFFTPRHSLELLGIPLDSPRQHATREEILSYYGRLARLAELELHAGQRFERLDGGDGDFTAIARTAGGREVHHRARKLVIATGVFGQPRRLPAIPGADHAKVTYRYREPFAYAGQRVVLVGAGNSAAGAALALHLAGARVTVLDRNPSIAPAKWRWHLEDLQQLVASGEITLLRRAGLTRIDDDTVTVDVAGEPRQLGNDAVIVQLGYAPDTALLDRVGVTVDATATPVIDPRTLETARRGVFLAGIVCAGTSPDRIFVWGARHHARAIVGAIAGDPPLADLADLGLTTIAHWAQFERLGDELDEALALRMVPVVTGEIADDFFDVYGYATRSANLYAQTPARVEQAGARSIGSLLGALDGWLLQRNDDGSVVYKGQRLSADAFEILRLCDGTRRIADILDALAAEYDQPADELRGPVLALLLSLLRAGKLTWRPAPLYAGSAGPSSAS
ncbi:MAG TPA: FAD-dependent oxidoreductase [Kofleriaceae bacterium]|nr:FAD-dependent oxidoreductase [Kofleriaceae bacterium]